MTFLDKGFAWGRFEGRRKLWGRLELTHSYHEKIKCIFIAAWIRSTLIFKIHLTTFDNLYFQKTLRQDKI